MAESYRNSNSVIVKTYDELLASAINYHKEFISKYEELNKNR